jgi:hypothetical protein
VNLGPPFYKFKIQFIISLLSFFTILFVACTDQSRNGTEKDVCQKSINQFEIKITASQETGVINPVPSTTYRFYSKNVNDKDWRKITSFVSDDEINSPCKAITYASETTAYFYMGWKYSVTNDTGNTWSVWDAEKDLPGWKPVNYKFIRSVVIDEQGKGKMELNPIRFSANKLITTDYGKTWSIDHHTN